MLAKISAKNRVTLPKVATQAVGPTENLDGQASNGRVVPTPVQIQGGDGLRAKPSELCLGEADLDAAVAWSRQR